MSYYGPPYYSGVINNGQTGCLGFRGPWPPAVPTGEGVPAQPGNTAIPAEPVLPDPAVPTPPPPGVGGLISNPVTPARIVQIKYLSPSTIDIEGRKFRLKDSPKGVPVLEYERDPGHVNVPGEAGDIALFQGWFDAEKGVYRPEIFSADFQQKIYDQGWNEMKSRSVEWSYKTAQDSGYPWEDPTLHIKNYPMPGAFYDAGNPQGAHVFQDPEMFLRALLGSILVMAEMDTSLATSYDGRGLRKQLSDLLIAPQFNDVAYGTTTTALTGGRRGIGPKQRGINWDARHAPVRKLLTEGKTPYRTTMLDGRRMDKHIEADAAPLLWIPAVNLDVLRTQRRLSPEGLQWSDGRSTLEPPPAVNRLGIDPSDVRFPGGHGHAMNRNVGTARDWWARK